METTQEIRELNDAFRTTFTGGKALVTSGVSARHDLTLIMGEVRAFTDFEPGNDPYNEHDFGAIKIEGKHIFWKIDYYDSDLSAGSPDPSDPALTTRVITIMLADEY